jgi:hypothetical protein
MYSGPTLISEASWEWLKKRLVLCHGFRALTYRTPEWNRFLQTVRTFGDVGLTTSYLSVIDIWSGWNHLHDCECWRDAAFDQGGTQCDPCRRIPRRSESATGLQPKAWISGVYEGYRRELLELDDQPTTILTGTGVLPMIDTRQSVHDDDDA